MGEIWDFRSNTHKLHDTISTIAYISARNTQSSMLGPSSYTSYMGVAFDLHPQDDNSSLKYADDTYLVVGSKNIRTVINEFARVGPMPPLNNLKFNPHKTR